MLTNFKTLDSLVLQTKRRRPIKNEFGRPPKSSAGLDDFYARMKAIRPDLLRRSADSSYNCYGMAFANRRTHVHEDALAVIFEDDGYRIIDRTEAMPGDLVIYRKADHQIAHVAVVIRRDFVTTNSSDDLVVLSQWGNSGEFIHKASEAPQEYGQIIEIWTERSQ
jgi:cell wall-associated NlpC family hydrolase